MAGMIRRMNGYSYKSTSHRGVYNGIPLEKSCKMNNGEKIWREAKAGQFPGIEAVDGVAVETRGRIRGEDRNLMSWRRME